MQLTAHSQLIVSVCPSQVLGLVKDGCVFVVQKAGGGGGQKGRPLAVASARKGSPVGDAAAATATSGVLVYAKRGQAGPLHHVATVGDANRLRELLAQIRKSGAGKPPLMPFARGRGLKGEPAGVAGQAKRGLHHPAGTLLDRPELVGDHRQPRLDIPAALDVVLVPLPRPVLRALR